MDHTKHQAEISHVDHIEQSPNALHRVTTEDDIKGHDFSVELHELPHGYFRSMQFLGSMFAIGLSLGTVVGGFALIAPILGISKCTGLIGLEHNANERSQPGHWTR